MTVGLNAVTDTAVSFAFQLGRARPGGQILILGGTPCGVRGAANRLRFAHAPA